MYTLVVISHCIHSSDLDSLGKACHWSPCPPAEMTFERISSRLQLAMCRRVHTHTHTLKKCCLRSRMDDDGDDNEKEMNFWCHVCQTNGMALENEVK